MVVPAENLVGVEGRGFRYILDGMNAERLLIAAECIGDAKWFLRKATDYARDRQVFGRPIGQNQGIQFPLARAYAQMRAAELMVQAGCAKFEAGETPGEEANMAKMLGADAAWAAAEACIQTHRRVRLRRGIRCGAEIPRNAAVSGGADQHEPDPVVSGGACAGAAAELLKRARIFAVIAFGRSRTAL